MQKLAALNSNTATRHVLQGSLYITRTIAECLAIRTADILEYADFRDEFAMQIGKYNLKILEDIKDLYMYDFGIFIEVAPDEEQKAMLEQNIKMANQLLKLKRKKKQEAEQAQREQEQQMQAQMQMQAQQAKSQAEMQKIQMESQAKIQYRQADVAFEIEKLKNEAQLKRELMQTEFEFQMQLKGMEQQGLQNRENEREEAKNSRISKQSTQTSKMIEQKKRDLPAINFESNEDSLDGFDLAEFEPR